MTVIHFRGGAPGLPVTDSIAEIRPALTPVNLPVTFAAAAQNDAPPRHHKFLWATGHRFKATAQHFCASGWAGIT